MEKFIDKVVAEIISNPRDLENLTLVLPGNRPKLFIRNAFKTQLKNSILPEFLSIDDFILKISGLESISQIQLWFQAYISYKKITSNPDEFEVFLKWIPTLLKDFDDINSALVNPNEIFDYLVSVERIKKWGQEDLEIGSNQLMSKHLYFWKMARDLFFQLNEDLLGKGLGYRGLIYRKAVDNLPIYVESNVSKYMFLGLNALSKAEKKIIFELEKNNLAEIFWDSDSYYMEDENQEAGYFLRQYKEKHTDWNWSFNAFSKTKHIEVTSTAKRVGQAKYLNEILQNIPNEELTDTVVVLAEETLLPAVLSAIPAKISKVNITMGFPLNKSTMAFFFRSVFELQMNREKLGKGKSYYYKNVVDILANSLFKESNSIANQLKINLQTENRIFSSPDFLMERLHGSIFKELFYFPKSCEEFLVNLLKWIQDSMKEASVEINDLDREFLYRFSLLFAQLKSELDNFQGIQDFKTLYVLYNKLLQNESISFVGEPLEGLQIVGLLETRLLDFKNVIMTSVNDGIIPPGRIENSFIPFDIRREMGMNTFSENDAVFAYHFYRLLQRAETVQLIYNSEPDALGSGEKSRFITQIEIESEHSIQFNVASAKFESPQTMELEIPKTASVMEALNLWVERGISPSSLNSYLRNPINFYQQRVLGLRELEDAEETVGARILGNIVHETLEDLYAPLIKKVLMASDFDSLFGTIKEKLEKNFKIHYKSGDFKSGKNLLVYKIAESFVENVLKNDQLLASKNELVFLELEKEVQVQFQLQNGQSVSLKGVIDRIDLVNGKKRIIDYKTGTVQDASLKIYSNQMDKIFNENKKDKALQLLFYAYLYWDKPNSELVQFGIYPLKSPKKGVLLLNLDGETDFDCSILDLVDFHLNNLIMEILNPEIPFRAERILEE